MTIKKTGSPVWLGFFLALTVSLGAVILNFAINFLLGYLGGAFPALDSFLYYSYAGMLSSSIIALIVIALLTYHQIKYVTSRYTVTNASKTFQYAMLFFVLLGVPFYVYDYLNGFVWFPEDYVFEVLSILIFGFFVNKYVK